MPQTGAVLTPAGLTGARVTPAGQTPLAKVSAVDPLSVPGCVLQLYASSLGLADGAQVATWPDLSGKGHDLLQASSSLQPLYKAGRTATGGPTVRTDGVDDYLRATFTLPQPVTLVVVLRQVTVGGGAAHDYILAGATANPGFFLSSTPQAQLWGGSGVITLAGNYGVAAFAVFTAIWNGASSLLRINGATAQVSGSIGGTGLGGLTLGASNTPDRWTNIDFADVLAYNRVLAAPEYQYLEQGLGVKEGIAVT